MLRLDRLHLPFITIIILIRARKLARRDFSPQPALPPIGAYREMGGFLGRKVHGREAREEMLYYGRTRQGLKTELQMVECVRACVRA